MKIWRSASAYCVMIFAGTLASAQMDSTWERLNPEITGAIRLNANYELEPSSQKDKSAFKTPGVDLNFGVDPMEDIWIQIGLQGGPSRDTVNGKWNLQISTAYAEFLGLLGRRDSLRYGLVSNPWIEYGDALWGYRLNCDHCAVFAERYKYISRADLGLTYRSAWASGSWSLNFVNGEGVDQDEKGPGKDFQIFIEWLPLGVAKDRRLAVAGSYIIGNYENVDPEKNKKERILLQLHYLQRYGLSALLEAFWGRDPVDIINQKVADQVDLSDQGGKMADSQGLSVSLKYAIPDIVWWRPGGRIELIARHDELNPMQSVSGRGLKQDLLGFGFFPRQNLQISLAWSQVRYEAQHSALVGDSQIVSLSTQIGF